MGHYNRIFILLSFQESVALVGILQLSHDNQRISVRPCIVIISIDLLLWKCIPGAVRNNCRAVSMSSIVGFALTVALQVAFFLISLPVHQAGRHFRTFSTPSCWEFIGGLHKLMRDR